MKETEFLDPNGGAYECEETRTGPPLEYVAEKLRRTLEALHDELHGSEAPSLNLRTALNYGATSYLALRNMLGLTHRSDWFDRIEGFSPREFREWLDRVDAEGAVRG